MTSGEANRISKARQWLAANRLGFAVLGVIWTGVMFLFVRDVTISVICGLAFVGILAATLPRFDGS